MSFAEMIVVVDCWRLYDTDSAARNCAYCVQYNDCHDNSMTNEWIYGIAAPRQFVD